MKAKVVKVHKRDGKWWLELQDPFGISISWIRLTEKRLEQIRALLNEAARCGAPWKEK